MASLSTEAAASSSTDHPNHYTYEVFLSFRGEDTRSSFTDHLHSALYERGIKTFIDDELRRGEEISSALVKAIEESRVSVIVFSQNYASSRWCLDELVMILECRKFKGQEVRPVFYKVDPSDVRHQRGAFGDAFATLDQHKHKDSLEKWKAALTEAADLSGWPFKDGEHEAKFIKKIVGELSTRVVNLARELHVTEHPIGLESCREDVNKLLHAEEHIVLMVGIWGPGGIGKTTIAKSVFNSIRHKFDSSCFLADIRSNSNGLPQLQERLLFDIFRDLTLKVQSVDEGVAFIKTRLRHKKVLIILDDVSHSSQLQKLVPFPDCFGPGSRILITTRDKRWLTVHQVDEVYEVKMLNDRQALELFSLNAFNRIGPPDDYLELARRAVSYAQGLPLALIVLGSHLFRRSRDEWEAILDRGEDPHREIRDVLKLSYDALGADLKGYFLDIACFFKGQQVDHVKPILEACYDLKSVTGFAQLQEKALIRIDRGESLMEYWEGSKGRLWMHDLIEEMGKDIVYQESPDEPGERSRLWSEDDVNDVLTNNTGTNKVLGIQLPILPSVRSLNAGSFSKMKKLRYISMSRLMNYKSFSGDIDYLSNQLRWLDWPGCPLKCFPSDFHASKLVKLNISDSRGMTHIWEGHKTFPKLKKMCLRGCISITRLPDFSKIPNLMELDLCGCKRLGEIPDSLGLLDKLVSLNVSGCSNLVMFPRIINWKSLESISICDCNLEEFPEVGEEMGSLKSLNISGTCIRDFDESIGNLIGLEILDIHRCNNLRTLPCSIYGLQKLERLNVIDCSKLVSFPTNTNILNDHDCSLSLPKLQRFSMAGCSLSDCDFLATLDCWETLEVLDLSGNKFVSLPALTKFVNLRHIDLDGCERIQELPELPPEVLLLLRGCVALEIEGWSLSTKFDWESIMTSNMICYEFPPTPLWHYMYTPEELSAIPPKRQRTTGEALLLSTEDDYESPDIEAGLPSVIYDCESLDTGGTGPSIEDQPTRSLRLSLSSKPSTVIPNHHSTAPPQLQDQEEPAKQRGLGTWLFRCCCRPSPT